MRKFIYAGTLSCALLFVTGWIGCVALKAEERLIAVARTAEKAEAYLKVTSGHWPPSWEAIFPDERERTRIRTLVEVDFNATVPEVANASADRFAFIRPIGPCSRSYEWQISRLIDTAKVIHGKAPSN